MQYTEQKEMIGGLVNLLRDAIGFRFAKGCEKRKTEGRKGRLDYRNGFGSGNGGETIEVK